MRLPSRPRLVSSRRIASFSTLPLPRRRGNFSKSLPQHPMRIASRVVKRYWIFGPLRGSRGFSMRRRAENDVVYSEKECSRFDQGLIKATENFDFKDYVIPDVRYLKCRKNLLKSFCNAECESSYVKSYSISEAFQARWSSVQSTIR